MKGTPLLGQPPKPKPKQDRRGRPYKAPKIPQGAKPPVPIGDLLAFFDQAYPDPKCGLNFADPFQLLAATILSAQCTDKQVNLITPKLFETYPDPKAMATAEVESIEDLVKTCGLYRTKAANLSKTAKILSERFDGQVPSVLAELVNLPGVGRKTANVVLGNAFGIPGLTVDTHLGRVSRRLGLSYQDNPDRIERDLMKIVPEAVWTRFSHQAIEHGRKVCRSQKPDCALCGLTACPTRPNLVPAKDVA
ncbi:MAG: endonuclease III [Deltaproteobacteria bacterium]|nr:endonuclease III [Deltaproteobacteria bacterium]